MKTFLVLQRNCSWATHVSTVATTSSSQPKLQITNLSLIAEIISILVVSVSEITNYVTVGDFKIFILRSLKTLKKWDYLHSSWIFPIISPAISYLTRAQMQRFQPNHKSHAEWTFFHMPLRRCSFTTWIHATTTMRKPDFQNCKDILF